MSSPALAEDERVVCVTAAEQAQNLRSAQKFIEAREQLLRCANASCPAAVRKDCTQWLTEMDSAQPSVVIKASDPAGGDLISVRVYVDGVQILDHLVGSAKPVNPGVHKFKFEAPGMKPVERQWVIREGEKRRKLAVKFLPLPPEGPPATAKDEKESSARSSNSHSVAPYILGGVGVVALGSFAYFGLSGRSDANDLAHGCGATKSCSEAQVAPVHRKLVIADISLGVSVVSLGLATYLWLSQDKQTSSGTAALQLHAQPGGAALGLHWVFQ